MNYSDIIGKVSKEMNIPVEVVNRAYKSYWKFMKQTIQSLSLKDDINEEEFAKLRTNFNIPSLGKMTCTYERMLGVKERFKHLKELRNAKS